MSSLNRFINFKFFIYDKRKKIGKKGQLVCKYRITIYDTEHDNY